MTVDGWMDVNNIYGVEKSIRKCYRLLKRVEGSPARGIGVKMLDWEKLSLFKALGKEVEEEAPLTPAEQRNIIEMSQRRQLVEDASLVLAWLSDANMRKRTRMVVALRIKGVKWSGVFRELGDTTSKCKWSVHMAHRRVITACANANPQLANFQC